MPQAFIPDSEAQKLTAPLNAVKAAIAQRESGGNYQAKSPVNRNGFRALGKWQIMENNLPSWSKEAIGRSVTPQEFLSNPNLQESIATYHLSKIYDKYKNPDDTASVWFSGRPLAGNTSKDITGTSVPQYVSGVRKLMGVPTAQAAGSPPAFISDQDIPKFISDSQISTPAPQPKQPGFVQGMAQAIANTPLRLGLSVARVAEGLTGIAKTPEQLGAEHDFGYLGKVRPFGVGEQGQDISIPQTLKQSVGAGAELASYGIGGGAAKNIIGSPLKTFARNVGKGALEGAVAGGLGQGGAELATDNSTASSVLGQTALGAVGGAAMGTLAGAVAGIRNARKPEVALTKVEKAYREALNPTAKQTSLEAKYNKNTPKFLAEEGVRLDVQDGKIDPSQAIDSLELKAKAEHAVLNDLLESTGAYGSLDDIAKNAVSSLEAKGSAREQAIRAIRKELDAYNRQYASEGIRDAAGRLRLPLKVINDIKQDLWSKSKFNSLMPLEEQTRAGASYVFGHAAKDAIERLAGDAGGPEIRNLNRRLGNFWSAIDLLEKRRGMPVKGGRLGRYFARTIGAAAGAKGGPLGSLAGAITADLLTDILQSPARKTAYAMRILAKARKEAPEALAEAQARIAANRTAQGARLRLPEPSPLGTAKNPIITPVRASNLGIKDDTQFIPKAQPKQVESTGKALVTNATPSNVKLRKKANAPSLGQPGTSPLGRKRLSR